MNVTNFIGKISYYGLLGKINQTNLKSNFVAGFKQVLGSGGLEVEESLIGLIDCYNPVFTCTKCYIYKTTKIYLNGLMLVRGFDYVENGDNVITFFDPPSNIGFIDVLKIIYLPR